MDLIFDRKCYEVKWLIHASQILRNNLKIK